MRYAENHKEETRKTVLRIAAAQLREQGPDRISVGSVMKAAGLTHGGFYAHFKSKDAMLIAALHDTFERARRRVGKLLEGLPPKHALATYIDFYVAETHRDQPGNGCPITALNSDMPRQSKKFKAAFEGGVTFIIDSLAKRMADCGIADAEALAPSIFATMAGAVSLSRTISDQTLSNEFLSTTRANIKARLGLTDAALASERPN
ncbi:MAG: TetR/AcrR family transcriptional regulator [Alphaproteobacteria bacterium]|nr:TetR/AcrR family transcriptional regulator [Alphaproteobacteria bacterium]MBL7096209.1 TetR/AcrR family transcriptional regulator [Alphaproteobacteria bacterium]